MKCGTSTLQAQLAAQPGIFMTTPKEPNYFSDDPVYARGAAWYRGLFDGAAPGDLTGEASTHYTKLPTYPETLARMTAVVPAARLIYILRDPVERAVSHYLHERSLNNIPDGFERALETQPRDHRLRPLRDADRPVLAGLRPRGAPPHLARAPDGRPARRTRAGRAFVGYPGTPVWQEEKSRRMSRPSVSGRSPSRSSSSTIRSRPPCAGPSCRSRSATRIRQVPDDPVPARDRARHAPAAREGLSRGSRGAGGCSFPVTPF